MKHSKIIVLGALLLGATAKPNQAAPKQMAKLSKVSILGEVQKPGIYSFAGKWRLLDAIVATGGMTAKPDWPRLSVYRGSKKFPINVQRLLSSDDSQNLPLLSGDVVFVQDAQSKSVPTVPPERFSLPLQPKGKELPQPDFRFFPDVRVRLLNKGYIGKK